MTTGTKYYFITKSNRLYLPSSIEDGVITPSSYILQEGEYLLYTNNTTDELIMLGSGTLITNNSGYRLDVTIENPDITAVESNDISKISWINLDTPLDLIEMNITTLGDGVELLSDTDRALTSEGSTFNSGYIKYKTDGINWNIVRFSELTPYTVYTKLNLNSTQDRPQLLKPNESINITFVNGETLNVAGAENKYIIFSSPVVISGGLNIDMAVLTDIGYEYSLYAHTYIKKSIMHDLPTGHEDLKREDGYIKITGKLYNELVDSSKNTTNDGIKLNFSFTDNYSTNYQDRFSYS